MPVIAKGSTEPTAMLGTGGLLLLCQKQQDAKSWWSLDGWIGGVGSPVDEPGVKPRQPALAASHRAISCHYAEPWRAKISDTLSHEQWDCSFSSG
jgi:hypothetical protein